MFAWFLLRIQRIQEEEEREELGTASWAPRQVLDLGCRLLYVTLRYVDGHNRVRVRVNLVQISVLVPSVLILELGTRNESLVIP